MADAEGVGYAAGGGLEGGLLFDGSFTTRWALSALKPEERLQAQARLASRPITAITSMGAESPASLEAKKLIPGVGMGVPVGAAVAVFAGPGVVFVVLHSEYYINLTGGLC